MPFSVESPAVFYAELKLKFFNIFVIPGEKQRAIKTESPCIPDPLGTPISRPGSRRDFREIPHFFASLHPCWNFSTR